MIIAIVVIKARTLCCIQSTIGKPCRRGIHWRPALIQDEWSRLVSKAHVVSVVDCVFGQWDNSSRIDSGPWFRHTRAGMHEISQIIKGRVGIHLWSFELTAPWIFPEASIYDAGLSHFWCRLKTQYLWRKRMKHPAKRRSIWCRCVAQPRMQTLSNLGWADDHDPLNSDQFWLVNSLHSQAISTVFKPFFHGRSPHDRSQSESEINKPSLLYGSALHHALEQSYID
jgi:hypothetical protein